MAKKSKSMVAKKIVKKVDKAPSVKAAAKKSQTKASASKPLKKIKAKSALKSVAAPPKQATKPTPPPPKVHPFANFMQAKNSHRPGAPSMQKFSPHDLYRKKAV